MSPVLINFFKSKAMCGEPSMGMLLPLANVFCRWLSMAVTVSKSKTFTALLTFSEAEIVPRESLDDVVDLSRVTK